MSLRRDRSKRRRIVSMSLGGWILFLIVYGLAVSLTTLFLWVEVLGNG